MMKDKTKKIITYSGLIASGAILATAATLLITQPCGCSSDHYKKDKSDRSKIEKKHEGKKIDESKHLLPDGTIDTTKIIHTPKPHSPNSRVSKGSIDDATDDTKTITIVDDRRYTSGNSTGSNKYNAGEPCVYQHPTDKDLYVRYSGTAGKKKGGSWIENHAGWVITDKPINTKIRDNIFKEWVPVGKMEVEAFYKINGPNYHINGRPGNEIMSDSAQNARYEQNLKNYDKSYVQRSGFKPQKTVPRGN